MNKSWYGRVILASALLAWGCGTTEQSTGTGGSSGSGSGGTTTAGTAGATGAAGASAPGAAGTIGAAGTGGTGAGGAAAGDAGATGTTGNGGSAGGAVTGTAGAGGGPGTGGAAGSGTTGKGGAGAGGTAGASAAGSGGSAGTTGGGGGASGVTVQLDKTQQTIDGFGINNTYAPAMDDATADKLFDVNKGIGLSILRIGMSPNGSHANSANPQDISKAKARGAKYIIGSTWSPPASCKDNGSTQNGGHLLQSCYGSWSDTIAKFAKDNSLYAMSPANEPDFASCGTAEPCNGVYDTTLYTSDEMVAFLKVVGPKLKTAGVKLLGPEASEWLHAWSNDSACCSVPGGKPSSDPLKCGFPGTKCAPGKGYDYGHGIYKDPTAWAALDILGVHQYDTQVALPWPDDVPDKKPIWQTEMSGVKWWPEAGPSSDINNGVAVAGWLHNALTVGQVNAWCWWWWKAQGATNEGLLLSDGTDTKRHYTYGNYTKFVRPGYTRVDVTGVSAADLLLTAFKGPDGTVVVVAINKGTAAVTVPILVAGGTAPASMTPWVTSSTDNLVSKTAVTVTGGSFPASLPGKTVTTFVGKP